MISYPSIKACLCLIHQSGRLSKTREMEELKLTYVYAFWRCLCACLIKISNNLFLHVCYHDDEMSSLLLKPTIAQCDIYSCRNNPYH